jgi:hypothetical protein
MEYRLPWPAISFPEGAEHPATRLGMLASGRAEGALHAKGALEWLRRLGWSTCVVQIQRPEVKGAKEGGGEGAIRRQVAVLPAPQGGYLPAVDSDAHLCSGFNIIFILCMAQDRREERRKTSKTKQAAINPHGSHCGGPPWQFTEARPLPPPLHHSPPPPPLSNFLPRLTVRLHSSKILSTSLHPSPVPPASSSLSPSPSPSLCPTASPLPNQSPWKVREAPLSRQSDTPLQKKLLPSSSTMGTLPMAVPILD